MYGMELKHPAFVDDVLGMGTQATIEDMVRKMRMLEEMKKYEFNTKQGKTNYMKMKNNKNEPDRGPAVTCQTARY